MPLEICHESNPPPLNGRKLMIVRSNTSLASEPDFDQEEAQPKPVLLSAASQAGSAALTHGSENSELCKFSSVQRSAVAGVSLSARAIYFAHGRYATAAEACSPRLTAPDRMFSKRRDPP